MPNLFGDDILAKVAANPKLASYLADPSYVQAVQAIQRNPQALGQYMQDPRVMETLGAMLGVNLTTATPEEAEEMKKTGSATPYPAAGSKEPEVKPEPVMEEPAAAPEYTPEELEEQKKKEQSKNEKEFGNQCYKSKKFDDALEHYAKAWELSQDDITVLTNKAGKLLLTLNGMIGFTT